jgi:hypothetical protein
MQLYREAKYEGLFSSILSEIAGERLTRRQRIYQAISIIVFMMILAFNTVVDLIRN